MESNWAAEHLQVIRTLMERSAVYRRALAPIMTYNGALGTAAAAIGWIANIGSARGFVMFWAAVCVVALAGSFLLVRRQALKDAEPFWSPPTRRVSVAFLPGLFTGFVAGLLVVLASAKASDKGIDAEQARYLLWLPAGWVVLYGLAMHAAGFFMSRGIRLFGWILVLGGSGLVLCASVCAASVNPNCVMGIFFGLLHLAYGVYLYFTEPRKNVA